MRYFQNTIAMRMASFFTLLILFFGCGSSKTITSNAAPLQKRVVFFYDEHISEFSKYIMIQPAVFLPSQNKAFQLDRSNVGATRILILKFAQDDDTSRIQIMANRFSYKNWLYTDTVLQVGQLTEQNACFRIKVSGHKNQTLGIVPEISLEPMVCNGNEEYLSGMLYLIYDAVSGEMTGDKRAMFRSDGFEALFKKPLIPKSPIIRLADVSN
jgi:hypothetical protein